MEKPAIEIQFLNDLFIFGNQVIKTYFGLQQQTVQEITSTPRLAARQSRIFVMVVTMMGHLNYQRSLQGATNKLTASVVSKLLYYVAEIVYMQNLEGSYFSHVSNSKSFKVLLLFSL